MEPPRQPQAQPRRRDVLWMVALLVVLGVIVLLLVESSIPRELVRTCRSWGLRC